MWELARTQMMCMCRTPLVVVMCFYVCMNTWFCVRVFPHFNLGRRLCEASHPVTAALHPRLPPPLPPFRSHQQQGDYSLATITLFTPYPPPITRLWHPSCHPRGVRLVGGGFTPLATLSQPYLWTDIQRGAGRGKTHLDNNIQCNLFLWKRIL